ncbi:MAG: hypothetical protein ACQEP8_03835 [Chlamydiota bacterium]
MRGDKTVLKYFVCLMLAFTMLVSGPAWALWTPETWGFYEMRAGSRLRDDPYQKQLSIMEARLQIESAFYLDKFDLKAAGDLARDEVLNQWDVYLREAYFFARPSYYFDLKIGRQILTTGTGDLLFINDLYPKDWQSFFIGRDNAYLKASSDAAKIAFFSDYFNCDLVYTPQFEADRYISGERLSYWNKSLKHLAGRKNAIITRKPHRWFTDDEISVRVYKNIKNYETSLYGYWGYWKSPGGQTASGVYTFPKLHVYGASIRGKLAAGIGNLEVGYYDSADDRQGDNSLVNNSEIRYLAGYTQEIGHNLTAAFQVYLEQLLDYSKYKKQVDAKYSRDRYRNVLTMRLTKLWWNQNLEGSFFVFASPTDKDAHLRPLLTYQVNDNLKLATGANVFMGKEAHTFFGQFRNNTNIYLACRYGF